MSGEGAPQLTPARVKYVRAVGPRLRLLLYAIFGLVAVLGANSVYLASITFLGWLKRSSARLSKITFTCSCSWGTWCWDFCLSCP